jgi:hypothetical protein
MTAAMTKRTHSLAGNRAALSSNTAEAVQRHASVQRTIRRRSTVSARVPPRKEARSIGPSSAKLSNPTVTEE